MVKEKYVVIVDGYSSSKFLSKLLNTRGYQCLHVQSSSAVAADFKKDLAVGQYADHFIFDGSIPKLCAELSRYTIVAAFAGVDTGVSLVDALNQVLNLPGNDPAFSQARYDKYAMAEQLKTAGVRHIPHCRTSQWSELIDFVRQSNSHRWVVKPLNSSGSDGVYICSCFDELKHAFTQLMNSHDLLGNPYREVLVQPYIDGREYVVNTVSCAGQHYVTDIWLQPKRISSEGRPLYQCIKLLPGTDQVVDMLTNYVKEVLNALKINYGPGHAEVVMTETDIVLIEIAARPMGVGLSYTLLEQALGHSQMGLMVDALIHPSRFIAKTTRPYIMQKSMMIYNFCSPYKQAKINLQALENIKVLDSCKLVKFNYELNSILPQTTDLISAPGYVILIHNDSTQVERDFLTLLDIESNGLFCPLSI